MEVHEQKRCPIILCHRVRSVVPLQIAFSLTGWQGRILFRLIRPIYRQSSEPDMDLRVSMREHLFLALARNCEHRKAPWLTVPLSSRYWGGLQQKTPHYPPLLRGLVNASANMGNIIGQLSFGYLGDIYGRRLVYGNELIIGIVGLILLISLPNSIPTATLKSAWIFCWRFVLGIGIGGDYPISAAIVAERSHLKTRGQLLGWIFSNQGWVS